MNDGQKDKNRSRNISSSFVVYCYFINMLAKQTSLHSVRKHEDNKSKYKKWWELNLWNNTYFTAYRHFLANSSTITGRFSFQQATTKFQEAIAKYVLFNPWSPQPIPRLDHRRGCREWDLLYKLWQKPEFCKYVLLPRKAYAFWSYMTAEIQ